MLARLRPLLIVFLFFVTHVNMAMAANEFSAGVLAYQNKRYEEAEALWLKVTSGTLMADAAYNLAILYENGHGLYGYPGADIEWYQRAAKAGSLDAQYNLAGLYYSGERIPKNINDAIYWWAQAGNQGHAQAQYNLGVILSNGEHIQADTERALAWLELAAAAGYEPALKLASRLTDQIAEAHKKITTETSNSNWHDNEELWLFHQDPMDYTLELYRHADINNITQFINKHNLGKIAHYYVYRGDIIVVAGLFNTEHDAIEAIAGLTEDLRTNLPRPIVFRDIHSRIRAN